MSAPIVEWQARLLPNGAWRKCDGGKARADHLLTIESRGQPIYEVRALCVATPAAAGVDELVKVLEENHSWIVCFPIATPQDLAESCPGMEELIRAAIAKATGSSS